MSIGRWGSGDIFFSERLLDLANAPPTAPAPLTLKAQVIERLRTDILEGTRAPGEALPVTKVAAQLGVSAPLVREAIAELARLHLIEDRTGRAYAVRTPTTPWFAAIAAEAAGLSVLATDLGIAHASTEQVAEFRSRAQLALDTWSESTVDRLAGAESIWDLIDLLAQYSRNHHLATLHHSKRDALVHGLRNLAHTRNRYPHTVQITLQGFMEAVESGDRLEGIDIVRDLYAYLVDNINRN